MTDQPPVEGERFDLSEQPVDWHAIAKYERTRSQALAKALREIAAWGPGTKPSRVARQALSNIDTEEDG